MENLFISDYLAKKADHAQFNGLCYAFYDEYGELCPLERPLRNTSLTRGYSAPMHQQMVDFLREKHNLHIEIHHWTEQPIGNEVWDHCYQYFLNGKAYLKYFKTYYEALNEAIEESLNLI